VTAVFVAAQVAGLASHVPGGAGVFEAVALTALSPRLGAPAALGLLVLYRLVYYLVPFVTAVLLLAVGEVARRRKWLATAGRAAMAAVAPIVPSAAAVAAFLAGAVLLVSGATPTLHARLRLLEEVLPLTVLEVSHLAGSVVGMALLLLAQALQRRLDGAWYVAVALLAAGAVASLVKGLDWEEAMLLTALLLAILPFRDQFRRRAALLEEPFATGWALAALLVLAASVWIGLLAHRHVSWNRELWWQFALSGDAPRFLRASVGAASLAAAFGVARLLRPTPPRIQLATESELAALRPLIARSPDSSAHLALLGDKAILADPGGAGFLMFGVAGRTFVAMGDPVGPDPIATDLAWRLRELADRHHGLTCFYQVSEEYLPRYLDMGLVLFKLGEEARVPLKGFSLEGGERRGLRQSVGRAERDGLHFEVISRDGVAALLPELRTVSDAWEGDAGEGLQPRLLLRALLVRGAAGRGPARRSADRLLQPLGTGGARRALARPHAALARRAERHHGIPLREGDGLGKGAGLPAVQPGHGPLLRAERAGARATLGQARCDALPAR
jgi:phosphatidylglycerol lysyltransferase